MTSLKDIQSLIADIDSILPKADARLPWFKPGDVARERLVLERVRSYLVSQQQNFVAASTEPSVPATSAQKEVVQQIVQAVTQEMNLLRADLMQPLQADVEDLRQQREALVQEIRQLEQKRQQIDSTNQRSTQEQQIISELSQGLINRCTETLTQQLAQILANFGRRVVNAESQERSLDATVGHSAIALGGRNSTNAPALSQHEAVGEVMQSQVTSEQLRKLQEQSDQMLTTLEANQRAIFEALGRDLQGYQASLSQGLEKMHSLGVQGEMLFTALVNRTLEQLRQQASTLFSSSVLLSDAASQTQEAGIRTTPGTLLPSDAFTVTERSPQSSGAVNQAPQPNPTPVLQPPLQPPQAVEPIPVEQDSAKADAINPISSDQQEAIPQALRSRSLPAPSQLSREHSVLENLNSEDWEIVEGLDSENLDFELDRNEQIDTFIQLDLDDQESLSSLEVIDTLSPLDSQETDFLLNWLNERQHYTPQEEAKTPTQVGEVTGLGTSEVAAELNQSVDRRRQEIDELYQNLFGTDSLTDTTNLDESDFPVESESDTSEPMQALEEVPASENDQTVNADSVTPLPPEVENVLFEGLGDRDRDRETLEASAVVQEPPATLGFQGQSPLEAREEWTQSWEDLLFEDSVPQSPSQSDLDRQVQPSSSTGDSQLTQNSIDEQQGVETIEALTDLLEEMGVSPSAPATEGNSVPAPTLQHSEDQTSEPVVTPVEDKYIPASPEEDLLETATLESDPPVGISLNPNTLQQLQQDLNTFEKSLSLGENAQPQEEQRLSSSDVEGSTVTPETPQLYEHNQPFPIPPQESLAEDWEEFVINHWLRRHEFADDAIPTAAESVESDFDPDLFPSEALELDQHSTVNAGAAASVELALPGELIAFEDENLVEEMQWDEPTDSTTEEAIAHWDETASFASPELEFGSDFLTQEALDSEPQGEGSTALPGALREEVHEKACERTQDPTLAQDCLENDSDKLPEAGVDLEQHSAEIVEHATPENKVAIADEQVQPSTQGLNEDAPSDRLTQEAQASAQANFDVNFPHPEVVNPEQPDNTSKIEPDSNSEAQP